MKIYLSVQLTLISLAISIVLTILVFILPNWLLTRDASNNYGIWQACKANTFECYRWYDVGQNVFNYTMTDSFKAFQGLQTFMLALSVSSFTLTIITIKCFPTLNSLHFFIILLILLSASCGTTSLVIFGLRIYDSTVHIINLCFWLSLASVILVAISTIFFAVFMNTLKEEEEKTRSLLLEPSTSTLTSGKTKRKLKSKRSSLSDRFKFTRQSDYISQRDPHGDDYDGNFYAGPSRTVLAPSAPPLHTPYVSNNLSRQSQAFHSLSLPTVCETLDRATQTQHQEKLNDNETTPTRSNELESSQTMSSHFHYHSEYDFNDFKDNYEKSKRHMFRKNPLASSGRNNSGNLMKKTRMSVQINSDEAANKSNCGPFIRVSERAAATSGYSSEPESVEFTNRTWISVVNEDTDLSNFYLASKKNNQTVF